ncbi:SRPBCC family protein [Streptomyces sp. NPDC006879]|uniref:type II toxin-antitoxin system Rv0910 family toxin n=1 Tax=Streptomyces sp. NPDC006879 TaxID=3364767 RepID=UPI003690F084
MAEVTAESHIEAPADRVRSQLTDWSSYGRWNTTHAGFPGGGPRPLAVGATFTENMKMMGFPAEVTWAIEELQAGRILAIRGRGPMGVTVATRYELTPEDNGTLVRIDGEFTGGAVSLMAGKLKDSATAALNESLRKLAGLLG